MELSVIRIAAQPLRLKPPTLIIWGNTHYKSTLFYSSSSSCFCSFTSSNSPRRNSNNDGANAMDEGAFEAERLRLDAEARRSMADQMAATQQHDEDEEETSSSGAWKWVIRKRIWDSMESLNIAQNPRPVHHRIPNFLAASSAAQKVIKMIFFSLLSLSQPHSLNTFHFFIFYYYFCFCFGSWPICNNSGLLSALRSTPILHRSLSDFSRSLVSLSLSLFLWLFISLTKSFKRKKK